MLRVAILFGRNRQQKSKLRKRTHLAREFPLKPHREVSITNFYKCLDSLHLSVKRIVQLEENQPQ